MEPTERSLMAAGRRLAHLQDGAPGADVDRDRGRSRLVAALRAPEPRRRTRPAAWAAFVAALLAVVAFLVLRPRGALRFDVGASEAGVVGAWIAAPEGAELPVRFSDGSTLRLGPRGRARVVSVDADGADVALEKGELDVSVVHRDRTRWKVRVGPFRIDVIGTRFTTRWDPTTESLLVVLREGVVEVSGPGVGEARRVVAGERLDVSASTSRFELGSAEAAPPAPAAPSPDRVERPIEAEPAPSASSVAASPSARAPLPAAPSASAPPPSAPASEAPPSWRALAREGKYKDALAASVADGFEGICATAPAADLQALADTARLAGDGARARQAMQALRQRFPGSPEAAAAAFLLARAAQDGAHDYATAIRWLSTYLVEQPNGMFAVEARGRLIEAADAMGDAGAARRAAERYLAAHPKGPHAAYARTVLARGAGDPP